MPYTHFCLYNNLVYKNHQVQIWCNIVAKTAKNSSLEKEYFMK